jgi:hypothetical protein
MVWYMYACDLARMPVEVRRHERAIDLVTWYHSEITSSRTVISEFYLEGMKEGTSTHMKIPHSIQ